MSDNKLIKIELNPAELIKASEDGKKFLITKNAEQGLIKLLELQQRLDEVMEDVKTVLSDAMESSNVLKIEGEKLSVVKQFFGERFEVYDKELANGLLKTVTTTKIDTDAVDAYEKANGQLPEGIKLRDRARKVQIKEKKKKV